MKIHKITIASNRNLLPGINIFDFYPFLDSDTFMIILKIEEWK